MHELGLMDAVIRTVERIIKEENLTSVRKIVLGSRRTIGYSTTFYY